MVWLICMVMILMVNCFLFMIFSCVLFCYFACFAFPVSLAASFWLGGIFTCFVFPGLTTREIARVVIWHVHVMFMSSEVCMLWVSQATGWVKNRMPIASQALAPHPPLSSRGCVAMICHSIKHLIRMDHDGLGV